MPRLVVGINGGSQVTSTEFGDTFTFERHAETGTTSATYPVKGGFVFDIGGNVRVWRRVGGGVAFTSFVTDVTVAAEANVPHPFFLSRQRNVSGEGENLEHEESAIHFLASYELPLTGRFRATLMGGPSVLQVGQAIVTDVNYSELYPYDTASFLGVDAQRSEGSAVGFNIGADVRWMFTRQVGAGVVLRYSRGTVDLDGPNGRTITVDAGGAQVAAGLRVAF